MLAPQWLLIPLVGLAAAATVIASQATISGAYSMTFAGQPPGLPATVHPAPRIRTRTNLCTQRELMMLLAVIALGACRSKLLVPWLLHMVLPSRAP